MELEDVDKSLNPWSLDFRLPGREDAFIRRRNSKLRGRVVLGVALLLLYICMAIIADMLGSGAHVSTEDGRWVTNVRIVLWASEGGFLAGLACASVFPSRLMCCGPNVYEKLVAAAAAQVPLFAALQEAWYLPKLLASLKDRAIFAWNRQQHMQSAA